MSSKPSSARLAASFLPSTAALEMTYACNHRCLFCSCPWEALGDGFVRHPELIAAQWKTCISELVAMGVTNFAFTGGEPLLNPHLNEIIEHAASCTVQHVETVDGALRSFSGPARLFILSNGLLMDEGFIGFCKLHRLHLSMSLPGLDTYREHTQGGSPENILHWFRQAHRAGLSTTVNVTVTRRNLHELYQTIASALLAGADTLLMNRFLPGGRGLRHANELSLSQEQIVEMLDIAEDVLATANRSGHVGTELPYCIVDLSRYTHLKVGTRCSAATGFFVVDPSGFVRVCNHSPVRLQHIDEIRSVKHNDYWKRFVTRDYLPSACSGCTETAHCDGGCREAAHIVAGAIDSPDPVLRA